MDKKKQIAKPQEIKVAKTNLSYEEYIKSSLEIISPQLSVKTYKLGTEDLPISERGRDIRVAFVWTKDKKKEMIIQFLIENTFWVMKNTNDRDREWMRNHADIWLDKFREMMKDVRPTKKTTPTLTPTVSKNKSKSKEVCTTQTLFDNAKKVQQ